MQNFVRLQLQARLVSGPALPLHRPYQLLQQVLFFFGLTQRDSTPRRGARVSPCLLKCLHEAQPMQAELQ